MRTYNTTLSQGSIGPILQLLGRCCLLFSVTMHAAHAAEFDPVDLNDSSLQSRQFEQAHVQDLVSACFSVIQDIGFHVVETESEPLVIVANSYGTNHFSLTINLQLTDEASADYQVRLMLDLPRLPPGRKPQPGNSPGEIDFYQNFFNHLNKAYFKERAI